MSATPRASRVVTGCAALTVMLATGCGATTPAGNVAEPASSAASADRPVLDLTLLEGLVESAAGHPTSELPALAADAERRLQAQLIDAMGLDGRSARHRRRVVGRESRAQRCRGAPGQLDARRPVGPRPSNYSARGGLGPSLIGVRDLP